MRSGRLIMIVGVVVFLVALIGGTLYLVQRGGRSSGGGGDAAAQPTTAPPVNLKDVVVAAQSVVPRGTRITADNNAVKLASWPAELVPPGALTVLEDAYDRVARVDILLNTPVTGDMLTEGGDLVAIGSDAALQIPPDRVAYALPVARWSSVAWAIQPGDHVDVLLSFLLVDLDQEYQTVLPGNKVLCSYFQAEGGPLQFTCVEVPIGRTTPAEGGGLMIEGPRGEQRPRLVTQLTVQDALVLRVGDWSAKKTAAPAEQEQPQPQAQPVQEGQPTPTPVPTQIRSLTLAVSPQDALVLKYAEETGTSMDLVLRSVGDAGKPFTTQAVTQQYIFDLYAIGAPPKLPYGITPPVVLVRSGMTGEEIESEAVGVRAPTRVVGMGE